MGEPHSFETEDQGSDVNFDVAAAVSATFYGQSLSLSFSQAARVDAQANFAQRLPEGQWTIGGAGGGAIQPTAYEADAEEDELEQLEFIVEQIERIEAQQREWAETMHRFGNVEMSGDDWSEMSAELSSDSALRRWLIDHLKKQGKSEQDAKKIADEAAKVSAIMATPESQRTREQRDALENASPDVRQAIEDAAERQRGLAASHHASAEAKASGSQAASASARADEFAARAPDIGTHYTQALAASEPLDKQKPAPLPEAKPAPAALDASGFA